MTALRNNKILLVVIVAAATAAAFWFLALSPKRKEASDLQAKTQAEQTNLQQAQQELAGYEKARTQYRANDAALTRLGKAVPADDDIRSLLVQLSSAAGDTHVDFAKLDVGGASGAASSSTTGTTTTTPTGKLSPPPGTVQVGTTGISAMPFTLTFDGGYFNLADFFSRLDHFVKVHNADVSTSGRLLRIETISLTPSSAGFPSMTAQVGAASYLVSPSGSGTAAPSTAAASSASTSTPAPTSGSGTTPATPATPSTTTATVTGAAR
jgi:Tfp pilus assembly protein PilO